MEGEIDSGILIDRPDERLQRRIESEKQLTEQYPGVVASIFDTIRNTGEITRTTVEEILELLNLADDDVNLTNDEVKRIAYDLLNYLEYKGVLQYEGSCWTAKDLEAEF